MGFLIACIQVLTNQKYLRNPCMRGWASSLQVLTNRNTYAWMDFLITCIKVLNKPKYHRNPCMDGLPYYMYTSPNKLKGHRNPLWMNLSSILYSQKQCLHAQCRLCTASFQASPFVGCYAPYYCSISQQSMCA